MSARTHTFATPQPLTLRLHNPAGDVEITAADTTETTVEVVPRGGSSSTDAAGNTRVELSGDGSRLDVEAPDRRFGGAARLGMLVRLPAGSRIDVRTASADVTCRGTLGGLEVATASGDLSADDVDGDASVASASGDVKLGTVSGAAECKTASGDIRATSVAGSCRANSASGDIVLGSCGSDVTARTASGDVQIRQAGQGNVQITSMSGDVKVGVRRGALVWLDLTTLSGRTRSDLDPQDGPPADDNADVLSISVRTMSGDITLSSSNLTTT